MSLGWFKAQNCKERIRYLLCEGNWFSHSCILSFFSPLSCLMRLSCLALVGKNISSVMDVGNLDLHCPLCSFLQYLDKHTQKIERLDNKA